MQASVSGSRVFHRPGLMTGMPALGVRSKIMAGLVPC